MTGNEICIHIRELSMIALLLIAFGCGCVKSCVPAFGGDQFKLPSEEKHMKSFFTYIYIASNIGAFLGLILLPIFRYFLELIPTMLPK